MEFHLDYKLEASTERQHEGLYDWCIRELDAEGNQVGADQVPWPWSLHFSLSELHYSYDLELTDSDLLAKLEGLPTVSSGGNSATGRELIVGQLVPEENYSMLGTARQLKNFDLRILKAEETRCTVFGAVSYTSEVDFLPETEDDLVQVSLTLPSDRFEKIAELIKSRCVNEASLVLGGVHGFYAEWSPGVSTNRVKVLAKGKEQTLATADDFDFEPPRLGEVGEFRLSLGSRQFLKS